MASQLRLRLGGRHSRNWNLGEEINSRLHPMNFSAPFGIIGATGTGRKTLASRFSAMDADVPPYEDAKTFFNSFHLRTVGPYDSLRPATLHLMAYICPPPVSGGHRYSTFDIDERERFCCFLFLFDVARKGTFSVAKNFMNLHSDLTTNFLVGNKCDLRVSVPQHSTVPRSDIDEETTRRGMAYYEVSARTKENVQSLLEAIQNCAFRDKYLMSL